MSKNGISRNTKCDNLVSFPKFSDKLTWPLIVLLVVVLDGNADFCNEVVFVYHNLISAIYDAHPN